MTTKTKLGRIATAQVIHWAVYLVLGYGFFVLLRQTNIINWLSTEPASLKAFGGLISQISAGFAGVSITALAIVFALPSRPVLDAMRDGGQFLDLCAWIASLIAAFLMVTVLGSLVTIAENPTVFFTALLASSVPLFFISIHTALRLALTLIAVARPIE